MLIRRALGSEASEAEIEAGLEYFLAYYRDHMLDYTVLYPGVRESLDRLLAASVGMAVLTNKPVRISQAIVEGLGLAKHFHRVYGGNSFEFKKPHRIGIDTLVEEYHVTRERTVMVGDSAVDVQTARNAGVLACGVMYGFQPETFEQSPPDFIVERLEQLADRVLDE